MENTPYSVQESTLANASEVFAKALQQQSSPGGNEAGTLGFPDDGDFLEAWQQLLFWIINKRLPQDAAQADDTRPTANDVVLWVSTWVLGDKYGIPRLQNAVMIKLLKYLCGGNFLPVDKEQINIMLRISPDNTTLRRLLAEEVVILVEHGHLSVSDPNDLAPSDGTAGLSASLLAASRYWWLHEKVLPRHGQSETAQKEYLIGDDYEKHWLSSGKMRAKKAKKRKRDVL